MKLNKIINGTYHLIFEKRKDIDSYLIRFFAPEFLPNELNDWYNNEYLKNKKDYAMDGCLLDREELQTFYNCNKNNLLPNEKNVYNLLKDVKFNYIIATSTKSPHGTLEHEVAHVLFESDYNYKITSINLIDNLPRETKNQIKKVFKNAKYEDNPNTFYNEAQAWIVGGSSVLKENGIDFSKSKKIIKKLKENFDNHFY